MIDINDYINHTKTTFFRLRTLLYMKEEITLSDYLEEMEYVPYLIDNMTEAMTVIEGMMGGISPQRKERALQFISYIRDNCKLVIHDPDPEYRLLDFFSHWQTFYDVLPDKLIGEEMLPILKRVIPDGGKLFSLHKHNNSQIRERLWAELKDTIIVGDKDDFFALCTGTKPNATLTNNTNVSKRGYNKDNAVLVDILFYLGYAPVDMENYCACPIKEIREKLQKVLKIYFGYSNKDASESTGVKYKLISENNKRHILRREVRDIFFASN